MHVSTLQKYALFGGLLEEQIESILPFMQEENYKSDDLLIAEGKPNDKIFFLIEGHVEVLKRNVSLARFSEGEAFGEMEVLDIMPSVATVRTVLPTTVMSISNKALRVIYNMDVKIFALLIMNLARDLSRRLRKIDERIVTPSSILY